MSTDSTGKVWRLKDLSAAEFSRLSDLLDSCLALSPQERTDWLSRLEAEDLRTADILRRLFATSGDAGFVTLLETGEVLTRHLASLTRGEETLIGRRVGPYRVLSLLGQGGMGSVWLAERADGLFARQVALKLVHPVLMGRRVTERFAREREILASLTHPHIARLLDAGITDAGQPYLALEYVAGKPITAYCDERQLSVNERLQLFLQVLSAVQYAHAHLIIHRDLKPSNILVTEDGEVQLLDFGIAKLLTADSARETELTQLSGRALTPDYAAPEQVAGAPITTAADVYALAVILYELLTGERPYRLKRVSRGALEEAILQAEPIAPSRTALTETAARARGTRPRKLSKALRGDLDSITMKALRKLPAERYATANAFVEDLTRYLRGDAVLAQRDSVAYRALKFARRHRVAIVVTMALILTLLGGLATTSYEARVASQQRDAAIHAQLRSLTQTAAARLTEGDVSTALGIIAEVIQQQGMKASYTPEALSVFQEARALDAQVLALLGHTDRVRSLSFSPDGHRIATGSYDKTARIWDVATGRQLRLLRGHTDRVTSVAFSPDGLHVVTASGDHTARIWDAHTGRELMVLSGHRDRVSAAAFAHDGQRIVTASHDGTARIWDAITGRQLMLLTGHADQLSSAAFAPDGTRIVTGSLDKTARIWEVRSGRQVGLLTGHTGLVTAVTFSPDGRHVATASTDQTARIWDAVTGQQQIMLVTVHPDRVRSVAFSPDGQRLITTSDDKTARIWDSATGRELMVLSGHTEQVSDAAFTPDARLVATASDDTTVRIWDGVMSREIKRLVHADIVPSAAFSPDDRRVVTASNDKIGRVWDYPTGREVTQLRGHTDLVESAAFSPDGERVLTASNDKTVRIWDALTGREVGRLVGHTDRVWTALFSHDGQSIVTASSDRTARIWNAATGQQMKLLRGHTDLVSTAVFSPDDMRVVTASDDATARIWDAATGRQIMILTGHTDQLPSAAFSPDGRRVITSSDDRTARIWDSATGRQIMVLSGHSARLESATFSADGRRVITASDDKTARIWDAVTGQQLLLLGGHTDAVETATFSSDGERALTASADGTARIWDARTSAVDVQIGWAEAARFDSLPSTLRFQLGLPLRPGRQEWPHNPSRCDESAAAPYDPDRHATGVALDHIATDIAIAACAEAGVSGNAARSLYQQGRALMARGDFHGARRSLEEAVARDYPAAHVDLAMLLSQPGAGMIDLTRAVSLGEEGWREGVTIAGFELGSLYEHGVAGIGNTNGYLLAPDNTRAWAWYRKGADAGEPNALARFAEEADEAASVESDPAKRKSRLLDSFKYYAAAAERARTEDWPDDTWRNWRYRRASLARLLAREGMMQEVADIYGGIRRQYGGD